MPNGHPAAITGLDVRPAACFPEGGPGLYQHVPPGMYHAADGIDWLVARAAQRSPAHARVAMKRRAAVDPLARRVELVRQLLGTNAEDAEDADTNAEDANEEVDPSGAVHGMADALRAHPAASVVLGEGVGVEHITAVGTHHTNVLLRARVDRLTQHHPLGRTAVLILPTSSAEPGPEGAFAQAAADEGRPLQAVFALAALQAAGVPCQHVVMVAVEREPPHAVVPYVVRGLVRDDAETALMDALRTLGHCQSSGVWPSYVSSLVELQPPADNQ